MVVLAGLCTSLAATGPLYSQGPSRAADFRNGAGFVLLSNGEVMEGQVQNFDREIEIRIDDTATVRTSNDRVTYIGKTMEELYLFQANRIQQWSFEDHLQLGRWCAQHKLFGRAMSHYEYLKKEIPDRTEFKQFQLELKEAMLRDQDMQAALTAAGISVKGSDAGTAPNAIVSPTDSQTTPQTGFNSSSMHTARVDRNLQEVFRRDIQPVLVSSCARTACHGTFSSNRLKLFDPKQVRQRDTLAQNLSAFTSYIDQSKGDADSPPELHRIYQMAVSRHGSLMQSPLDINDPKHQAFMERLREWIAKINSQQMQGSIEVANGTPSNSKAIVIEPASDLWAKAHAHEDKNSLSFKARAATAAAQSGSLLNNPKEMSGIAAAIAKLEEIERKQRSSKDPFDPTEFNTKFAAQPNSETSGSIIKK